MQICKICGLAILAVWMFWLSSACAQDATTSQNLIDDLEFKIEIGRHERLIKQRIAVAVQQLPLKYRSPLALAYLNDLSTAEIAQIEDCAEGTVKSRIHRAKQQLKLQLDDLLGEDDHA